MSLMEDVRQVLAELADSWVEEQCETRGVSESDALAELAELAGVGGTSHTSAHRASNLRRQLSGRVGISWHAADRLARALGVTLVATAKKLSDPLAE